MSAMIKRTPGTPITPSGVIKGLLIGLLVGLAVALGVVMFVTRAKAPWSKTSLVGTPEQDAIEARRNAGWNPNGVLSEKSNTAAALAAAASHTRAASAAAAASRAAAALPRVTPLDPIQAAASAMATPKADDPTALPTFPAASAAPSEVLNAPVAAPPPASVRQEAPARAPSPVNPAPAALAPSPTPAFAPATAPITLPRVSTRARARPESRSASPTDDDFLNTPARGVAPPPRKQADCGNTVPRADDGSATDANLSSVYVSKSNSNRSGNGYGTGGGGQEACDDGLPPLRR